MRPFALAALICLCAVPAAAVPAGKPPADGPPVERRLHFTGLEASSYLFNDWNQFQENYHPNYLGDDDPSTAWVEGAKGAGEGEWVRVKVTPMQGATKVRLRLRNGYQKSDRLFKANARAHGVTVRLLPSKVSVDRELTDASGWQELVVEQPAGALDAVELRIRTVFPGSKYEDLCLSDAQLYVTATTPDNPLYERSHLQKTLEWKKQRLAAAKLFKEASAKSLPIAPQYVTTTTDAAKGPPAPDSDGHLASIRERLRQLSANSDGADVKTQIGRWSALVAGRVPGPEWTPAQVVLKDKREIPRVDGLCTPSLDSCEADPCEEALPLPPSIGWLTTAQLGVFDLKSAPDFIALESGRVPACNSTDTKSFAWVHRLPGSDGKPRVDAILYVRCGLVSSREGSSVGDLVQLFGYDEHGRATLVVDANSASWLRWDEHAGVLAGGRGVAWGQRRDVERASEVAKR
jgi:hypothetical protein